MRIKESQIRKAVTDATSEITGRKVLKEAYVVQSKDYDKKTDTLSEKSFEAHKELLDGYVKSLNEISAKLDTAPRENVTSNDSTFRSLKIDETYNLNAAFLHGMFFENVNDPQSKITMDSIVYMRLERDFGSFENWQKDFIACGMAARNGWVVTVYSLLLKRYMNVVVDLHSTNVPFGAYPVIVLDCWEHTYYRDFLKDRKSYIFSIMKNLNWNKIESRVEKAERLAKAVS